MTAKKENKMSKYLLCIVFIMLIAISGCRGLGLEKKSTAVPDAISFRVSEDGYVGYNYSITATWYLKKD